MDARQHFNAIAQDYDYWKKKNAYYHSAVKKLLQSFIPKESPVLEIGCGTGDILAALHTRQGTGIDISEGMIQHAQNKYPSLTFLAQDIGTITETFPHDFVVLVDVLEHVENVPNFMRHVARITRPEATTIITLANPAWEPILEIAEKLHLKMPEGPHNRMSVSDTEATFQQNGYTITEKGHRLLIPKYIPGANWVNAHFYTVPLLKNCGVIEYWVLKRS